MLNKLLSVILALSIINISTAPTACFAKISYSEINEAIDDFDEQTKQVSESQRDFYERHKWKIITGAAVGTAVAGTIAFFTLGTGTVPGIVAGAGTASALSSALIGETAAISMGTWALGAGASAALLYDYSAENEIKMTPELHDKIMQKINYNRRWIMDTANDKNDAMKIMQEIAINVMKDE